MSPAFAFSDSFLVKDWTVSRSTLERIWSLYFQDVKIPATHRFYKCKDCDRLKKMINTGDIEADNNLSTKEYEKHHYDKVFYKKKFFFGYMSSQCFGIPNYIF